jgi:hypothetical protein
LNVTDDGAGTTGVMNVSGNLAVSSYAFDSNPSGMTINLIGTTDSTVSYSGSNPMSRLNIAKTSGAKVSLASNLSLTSATTPLTVTTGNLNMAGYNLTVAGSVTNSTSIIRGTLPGTCGTYSFGSLTGSTPVCLAGSGVNVALATSAATATASSTHSSGNFPIAAIINGDRRGLNWGAGGGWNDNTMGGFPDWIQVDFANAMTISEIDFFTAQENISSPGVPTLAMTFTTQGVKDFTVQIWDTGTGTWVTVTGGVVTNNFNVWRQFTFTAVSTTKIRVTINNTATAGDWSRVMELEAWTP